MLTYTALAYRLVIDTQKDFSNFREAFLIDTSDKM